MIFRTFPEILLFCYTVCEVATGKSAVGGTNLNRHWWRLITFIAAIGIFIPMHVAAANRDSINEGLYLHGDFNQLANAQMTRKSYRHNRKTTDLVVVLESSHSWDIKTDTA